MDLLQAMEERHSVRAYTEQKIEEEKRQELALLIKACNEESGLHIQIRYDDPVRFDSRLARYGQFRNVSNYLVLAGPAKMENLDEKCGYYGEKIVLEAQMMGLNTCWVALTFNKSAVKKLVSDEDRLVIVIAIGYGENQGKPHKSRKMESVVASRGTMPAWFEAGVKAALLAPTAVNQQKFRIGVRDGKPVAELSGFGFYNKVDLGIVKYHFEVGSGHRVV